MITDKIFTCKTSACEDCTDVGVGVRNMVLLTCESPLSKSERVLPQLDNEIELGNSYMLKYRKH